MTRDVIATRGLDPPGSNLDHAIAAALRRLAMTMWRERRMLRKPVEQLTELARLCRSQYPRIAAVFSDIHSNTARSSSGNKCPAMTCGLGRTPMTAVFAMFIWSPRVMLTLIRTCDRRSRAG